MLQKLEKPYLYFKGIELTQHSQIKITQNLLREILNSILIDNKELSEIIKILEKYRKMIIHKEIENVDDITVTKKIGRMPSEYVGSLPAHVQLAVDRKAKGEYFCTIMTIGFVVISDNPLKIIHRDDYIEGQYDAKYYWGKQVWPPTFRLLKVVYPEIYWERYSSSDKHLQMCIGDF